MCSIYDQWLAIFEYFRNVEVASVSHPKAVFPELFHNILLIIFFFFFFVLFPITFREILHDLLYHTGLQNVRHVYSFS